MQLSKFALDTAGLARLARVATVLKEHPNAVNTKLDIGEAKHYYQVIHDRVEVFAVNMTDL